MKFSIVYLIILITLLSCFFSSTLANIDNEAKTSPATVTPTVTPTPSLNCTGVICQKITPCVFPNIIIKPVGSCCPICL